MDNVVDYTVKKLILASQLWLQNIKRMLPKFDLLFPIRHWLNSLEITEQSLAHRICQLVPSYCPFERNVTILSRTIHIPPLCKLNPLYEEVIALRFRALCYLADECGEDISAYC